MIFIELELLAIGVCLIVLFVLSLVESALTHSSTLALRMVQERAEAPVSPLLSQAIDDRARLLAPLDAGALTVVAIVAILTTHLCLLAWPQYGPAYAFLAVFAASAVFRHLLPGLLTQNDPERKLVELLRFFGPVLQLLRLLIRPLSSILDRYRSSNDRDDNGGEAEGDETSEEEIQAYLEIGEDEGILQEEDTKLIQSVVEFGNTLVREVMTPRTKIVACEELASIGDLRETMIQHRHSRIPIYREDIDHIIGIAYIRQLMAAYVKGSESDGIAGLINPVLFVPETKPVSKLLKELQERGDHVAIVIDEFGGVAGLATIEDLVEEIIGEIRDEDEAKVSKIIEEGPGAFVVRGSTELARLEDLSGKEFHNLNCSTVAGLVAAYLGRVPATGETFDLDGLEVRILDADRKRVHWIRVRLPEEQNPAEKLT